MEFVTEVEIKIEFNEQYETDPLVENAFGIAESHESDDDKFSLNAQAQVKQENDHDGTLTKTEDDSVLTKTEDDRVCSVKLEFAEEATEDNKETNAENNATWHKYVDSSGRFVCQFCDLTYATTQTLRSHCKTKHPDKAINITKAILSSKRNSKNKCHVCKEIFTTMSNLKDHVSQQHNLQNINSCIKCDANFRNCNEMLEHLFHKHSVVRKQIFSCNICGYRTLKSSHFKKHEKIHAAKKNMECSFCDYRTYDVFNLKRHERIHTANKPYKCDYDGCNYRCATNSGIKTHQLKHNRDKSFLYCDRCSYKTLYKNSLRKHINSHERNTIRVGYK